MPSVDRRVKTPVCPDATKELLVKNRIQASIPHKSLIRLLLAILVSLFCITEGLLQSARAEISQTGVLDEVLEARRTKAFLSTFLVEFEEALKRRQTEIDIDELVADKLLRVARRVYRADNLYDAFKHSFGSGLASVDSAAVRNWSKSEVGVTVGEGFERAFDPNAFNHTWAYMRQFERRKDPHNRANAARSFLINSLQLETLSLVKTRMDYGVHLALNFTKPTDSHESRRSLRGKTEQRRLAYERAGFKDLLQRNLYLLKALNDEEIDGATTFFASAAGLNWSRAWFKALESTLDGAATTVYRELVK